MFRSYLKVALRNIKEQKGYSFINIASLAIGLSCCMLILLYVRYELSYDKYHDHASSIYRAVREEQGRPVWFNSSEHPLAAALKEDFPEVTRATRVKRNDEHGVVEFNSKLFNEDGIYYADQDFLEMFTFPLVSGDRDTALKEPFSVLLTQEMSEKYFGNQDPVGQTLRIKVWYGDKKYGYKVSGVLKNIPKNSHFTFDFLVSYNTLYTLKYGGRDAVETWSYYEPKTYIQLDSQANPAELEEKFPAFLRKYKGKDYSSEKLHLQLLTDIHLGGNLRFELETNNDIKNIYLFSAIAFFIMVIACLNYVNLSVARSTKRAVEVGMRKVVGAHKSQLVRQFLGESMVFSLLAFLISVLIVELALPVFGILINRNMTSSAFLNPEIVFVYLGFSVLIGFLSGSYPAFIISSFHPIQILKIRLQIGSKRSVVFRDSLVVVQFVISIILIICTLVIHNQLSYIRNRDLGFEKDQIITVYTMDRNLEQNSEIFKRKLMDHPGIVEISASLDLPSTVRRSSSARWSEQGEERELSLNYTFVDYDFFNVYDIGIVEGRAFSEDFLTDEEQAIVLNETAVRELGWENPVGRQLTFQERERRVIGVIKDFHYHSLHREIDPLVFMYHRNWQIDYFSIKVNPSDIPGTLGYIEEQWKEFSPEYPFQYAFLDERIDRIYKAEQKLGQSFNIFTFIALSIACLGLIGLASFISEQKKKEISIRKILGADMKSVLALTAKEYVKCIAVAAAVAWPAGYLIMDKWLQNFAYRTSLGIGIFILSGLLAFVIALITVSYQSIKAAVANPADSLRYE